MIVKMLMDGVSMFLKWNKVVVFKGWGKLVGNG